MSLGTVDLLSSSDIFLEYCDKISGKTVKKLLARVSGLTEIICKPFKVNTMNARFATVLKDLQEL